MKIFLLFLFACIRGFGQSPTLYNCQFTTQDNRMHALSEFKGKRIMFIILPSSKTAIDSSVLSIVNLFSVQNSKSVSVIAIPSIEDGYSGNASDNLDQWYKNSLGGLVIVTSGMSSRKSSASQDPVLAWLTHASKNGHFDQDITGSGQVYFINETGQLYGEISPGVVVTNKILNKILSQP